MSTYSSVTADHQNIKYEEEFKKLVMSKFPTEPKEMENFAETFINRGMKCKSARGYMKFIEIIEEGSQGNHGLYDIFVIML